MIRPDHTFKGGPDSWSGWGPHVGRAKWMAWPVSIKKRRGRRGHRGTKSAPRAAGRLPQSPPAGYSEFGRCALVI